MLDAGTLEAARAVREKGSVMTGPCRVGAGDSQDHSLLQSGLWVGGLRTGVSESISPNGVLDWAWSAHSTDPNPDPCGRCQGIRPTRCGWCVLICSRIAVDAMRRLVTGEFWS